MYAMLVLLIINQNNNKRLIFFINLHSLFDLLHTKHFITSRPRSIGVLLTLSFRLFLPPVQTYKQHTIMNKYI